MKTTYCTTTTKINKLIIPILIAFTVTTLLPGLITTNAIATTQFEGSLKNVGISDAAGSNTAPIANFTYIKDGDTVTFNASGSSDSDGIISEYRWNFGDGTIGSGAVVTHQFPPESFPVTLTVVDDKGGISLSQITLPAAPAYSFYWAADTDNANYPADKIATYTGNAVLTAEAAQTGTAGLDTTSQTLSNASFTINSTDIADPTKGTIEFWMNVQIWDGDRRIMVIKSSVDGLDYVGISLGGVGRIYARSRLNGIYFITSAINTSAAGAGEWFKVVLRWDLNADYITVESNGNIATNSSVTGTYSNEPNLVVVGVGDTYGIDTFIDEVKIYKDPMQVIP